MQPHAQSAVLSAGLENCAGVAGPWRGTLYRFLTVAYANRFDLISGAGSRHKGGRWNPPGQFNVIYGSLNPQTAIAESLGTFSAFGIPPEKARPRVFAAISLKLQSLLDVSDPRVLDSLGVTRLQLEEEDWQASQDHGMESLTQAIGRIAWEIKLEAIIIPSARLKDAKNIAVFPGRRLRGSSWKIIGSRDLPKKE